MPEALTSLLARVVSFGSPHGVRPGHGRGSELDDSLVMLSMGYDASLGRLVDRDGLVDVRWPATGRDPVQLAARDTATAMAAFAGSPLVVNGRTTMRHHADRTRAGS